MTDMVLIQKLRKLGIVIPVRMLKATREAGLPISLAASVLTQESGGGHNVWGHDPTIFVGGYDAKNKHNYGPNVTKNGYLAYKAQRGSAGQYGMQGVGPCQLTYFAFQDKADEAGGCWDVLANMRVGFQSLAANIRRDGLHAGVAAYNGSGPAAEHYAVTVLGRSETYARFLGLPSGA